MSYQDLPEAKSDPDDQNPDLRQSADPDPDPDADTATDRPAGLGEPAEHPDPMVPGTG